MEDKEEPKQPYNNLNYGGGFTEEDIKRVSIKQETLEEAAKEIFKEEYICNGIDIAPAWREGFVTGANWQAERMYSEEEVYHILCEHTAELFKGSKLTLTEWFNQFKKTNTMIDLHKEVEKYADNTIGFSNENHAEWEFVQHHIIQFIQSSKYVQAEKLKAQIEVLKELAHEDKSISTNFVSIYIGIEQQLTQLENETH